MPPPLPRTSLLENVTLGPDGANFELDGRPVRLDARTQGASLAALREFHGEALGDFRARLSRAGRQPSWWGRLLGGVGHWLARVWGEAPAGGAPAAAPPPAEPPRPARPAPEAPLPGRAPATRPAPAKPAGPVLRSVCADRDGIHFVWRSPGAGDFHATCPVDSPLGRRLHACYAQLEELGYEVAGLERLRPVAAKAPAPEPAAGPTPPSPEQAPELAPAEPAPRPRRRAPAAPEPAKDAPAPAKEYPGLLPGL